MNLKHTKSKKTKSFSLLIVPESSEIKQFNVPSWIPKLLILVIIITLSSSSYFIWDLYTSFNNLEEDYLVKKRNLDILTDITTNQKNEIENLETAITEFEKRLQSITELETTVKSLVGLDKSTSEEDNESNSKTTTTNESSSDQKRQSSITSSRGGDSLIRRNPNPLDEISNREFEISSISNMLQESQKELSVLIENVEKRLAYLEAKPNLFPTEGRISSPFGYRNNPFGSGRELHTGIDISNWYGTTVTAAGSGVVTYAGYNGGYGKVIVIKHGYGYESIYAHNNKLLVKVGDRVEKGQKISEMGSTGRSTGPHLHFEIRLNSKPINPKTVLNSNE